MRPALTSLLAAVVLTATLAVPAAAASPTAGVRLLDCREGPESADRRATFRAVAHRVRGARRMWIRLRLEERTPRSGWKAVAAPGLGVWRKSRPGVSRFAIRQRVLALAEGSYYRVLARIRWYRADGRLLRGLRLRSRACRQLGDLPNLRVRSITAGLLPAGQATTVTYRVEIANRGRAAAPASNVRVLVDGEEIGRVPVPALAPGQAARVDATGPRCRESMTAHADADGVVSESDERDNALDRPCGLF